MGNESRIAQAQKADLYDRAVMQQQIAKEATMAGERGYAAGIMEGTDKANWTWANALKNKLYAPPVITDTDLQRLPTGEFVNSEARNFVTLEDGTTVPASVASGLADRAIAKQRAQDAWVEQSISPMAETQYPTYKGK